MGNWTRREEGIQLGRSYWPGLRWGELIFSRCAVDVVCHPDFQIHKRVADRSPLYFTHERMRREVKDLSHGWGSNSRWRTRFRFDYEERDCVIFNAGGESDLADPASFESTSSSNRDLPIGPRRELLVHRCFVTYEGPWDDSFPYDDTLAVRRADTMWPLEEDQLLPLNRVRP
ncbi:hypothetical protein [Hyalangium versicolor]|uniref:hypothetical protein n=1 Tax=Hyalangium versicolor TaxID=2861190 RepID=UPI001CC964A7|nr:hypothetical protein [Hyalangium versicolor]